MEEHVHAENTLLNRTYFISLRWYIRNFSFGALGRNYSQSLLTRTSHWKRRVKIHLYQSYNALFHMATVTCIFIQIFLTYLLTRVCFFTFLSKVSLFMTTITTSILFFHYSLSLFGRQIKSYFQRSIH
jgi:hypothetical protein